MTAISRPFISYQEKMYELLRPNELFRPEKHGLVPGKGSGLNPSGFHCTYKIEEKILYLDTFFTERLRVKGWKRLFTSYPPRINGVLPKEKELFYEDLALQIKYSGNLVLGERLPDTDGLDESDYENIFVLDFKQGKLL